MSDGAYTEIRSLEAAFLMLLDLREQRIHEIQEELKKLPRGNMYLNRSRGKIYFIHEDKSGRRGITNQEDLIYGLARKKYLRLLLTEHRKSADLIRREASGGRRARGSGKKMSRGRTPFSANSIEDLLRKYGECGLDVLRITCSGEQYRWVRAKYWSNPAPFTGRIYKTYSGIKVRSKSEQTIGNALELRGIPYRYEPAVRLDVSWMENVPGTLDGRYKRYYPDFVILTATGERILWEHLGCVDSSSYRTHNMEKISAYRQTGLVDDAHLILTFEKDLEDLDHLARLITRRIMPYM